MSENSAAVSIADVQKVISLSDTDYTGVVDLVRVSMQLVPQRRLPVELLLQFALFRVTPSTLSSSLTTSKSVRVAFLLFMFCYDCFYILQPNL